MTSTRDGWVVERHVESPSAFHARPMPEPVCRRAWVCEPDRPALVLGSAQHDDVVDRPACRAAGVAVARRRSGGGAVLVVPGELVWVDLLIPADDPLWEPDVGRAFHWLGGVWAAALAHLGVEAIVHRGPLVRTEWSPLVCFAGRGPGEVTGPAGELGGIPPKLVGISQRRTRTGARFQCAALLRWAPEDLAGLLALPDGDRSRLVTEVATAAAPIPAGASVLLDAFLARLPTAT